MLQKALKIDSDFKEFVDNHEERLKNYAKAYHELAKFIQEFEKELSNYQQNPIVEAALELKTKPGLTLLATFDEHKKMKSQVENWNEEEIIKKLMERHKEYQRLLKNYEESATKYYCFDKLKSTIISKLDSKIEEKPSGLLSTISGDPTTESRQTQDLRKMKAFLANPTKDNYDNIKKIKLSEYKNILGKNIVAGIEVIIKYRTEEVEKAGIIPETSTKIAYVTYEEKDKDNEYRLFRQIRDLPSNLAELPKKLEASYRYLEKEFETKLKKIKKATDFLKNPINNMPPINLLSGGAQIISNEGSLKTALDHYSKLNEEFDNIKKTFDVQKKQLEEVIDLEQTLNGLFEYEIEGYDLVLSLPDKEENVKKGKIYLSEDGRYVVRDPKGEVKEGTLNPQEIDFSSLETKLSNQEFLKAVLAVTTKNGHTKKELETGRKIKTSKIIGSEFLDNLDYKIDEEFKKEGNIFYIKTHDGKIAINPDQNIYALRIAIIERRRILEKQVELFKEIYNQAEKLRDEAKNAIEQKLIVENKLGTEQIEEITDEIKRIKGLLENINSLDDFRSLKQNEAQLAKCLVQLKEMKTAAQKCMHSNDSMFINSKEFEKIISSIDDASKKIHEVNEDIVRQYNKFLTQIEEKIIKLESSQDRTTIQIQDELIQLHQIRTEIITYLANKINEMSHQTLLQLYHADPIPEYYLRDKEPPYKERNNVPPLSNAAFGHGDYTFSNLTIFIQKDILRKESVNARIMAMNRWITIMRSCYENKDFQSLQAINNALNSEALKLLTATRVGLKTEEDKKFLKEMDELIGNKFLEKMTSAMGDGMNDPHNPVIPLPDVMKKRHQIIYNCNQGMLRIDDILLSMKKIEEDMKNQQITKETLVTEVKKIQEALDAIINNYPPKDEEEKMKLKEFQEALSKLKLKSNSVEKLKKEFSKQVQPFKSKLENIRLTLDGTRGLNDGFLQYDLKFVNDKKVKNRSLPDAPPPLEPIINSTRNETQDRLKEEARNLREFNPNEAVVQSNQQQREMAGCFFIRRRSRTAPSLPSTPKFTPDNSKT